ncbi:MAG: FAD-dependent monooxygenase, partial [Pseudomonadota bacterium]
MNNPIIVGANLTGLCTALALSKLNQPSILVDKNDLSIPLAQDGRAIALSYGSKQILEEIGVWQHLEPKAGIIEQIRVTDQYSPLFLHFDNSSILGFLVESIDLQNIFYNLAINDPNITILDKSSYELIENNHDFAKVKINDTLYKTELLIAADGKFSALRKLCNINHSFHDYKQTAIVCKVKHQLPHENIA